MNRSEPALARSGRNLMLGVWLVAAAMISGCQTPAAPFDPFLAGRNTIPPPGTAVPAAASPYYNAAPPTVTVPAPGATYTAPGAVPVAAPVISPPAAGGGQLPRGISVPQSNNPPRGDSSQLAAWQKSDTSRIPATQAANPSTAKPGKTAGNARLASASSEESSATQGTGVVRALHEEQSREVSTPTATAGDKLPFKSASRVDATVSRSKTAPSRKLPELTDFPPATGGVERTAKQ
jgi:hypothetical protein